MLIKSFFKLRLGALMVSLSVCLSVGLSVSRSSKNYKKNTKLYKTLQNSTKQYKTLQNIEIKSFCPPPFSAVKTVKEASAVCRSFLDGVVIFFIQPGQWLVVAVARRLTGMYPQGRHHKKNKKRETLSIKERPPQQDN